MQEHAMPLNREARDQHFMTLLQQIAAGDPSTLVALYDATSPMVFGLALRMLRDHASAEDVVIEVYTQVWRQAQTYDPCRGTPLTWLLVLTRSRALDVLRAQQRTPTTIPLATPDDLLSDAPDLETASIVAEQHRLVQCALMSLRVEQRQTIELAYFAGLSANAIAHQLGQPVGTVKTRLRLALKHLRMALGPLLSPRSAPPQQERKNRRNTDPFSRPRRIL